MLFTVTVMHNLTREDGRLAILARDTVHRLLPGDTLKVVGVLAVPARTVLDAADAAYALGNGAGPDRLVHAYQDMGVRSLCAGDALIIQAPGGRRHLLACATTGWAPVGDLRAYTILTGHPPTTGGAEATRSTRTVSTQLDPPPAPGNGHPTDAVPGDDIHGDTEGGGRS